MNTIAKKNLENITDDEWRTIKHDIKQAIGCCKNLSKYGKIGKIPLEEICNELEQISPKLEKIFELLFVEIK